MPAPTEPSPRGGRPTRPMLHVVHVNHLGEQRYQPRTPDGRRPYADSGNQTWRMPGHSFTNHPVLYRSRWAAERAARRELRRKARILRRIFTEKTDQ